MEFYVARIFGEFLEGGSHRADILYENDEAVYYYDRFDDKNVYPGCSYIFGEPYKLTIARVLQGNKKTEEFEVVGNKCIYRDFFKPYECYMYFENA